MKTFFYFELRPAWLAARLTQRSTMTATRTRLKCNTQRPSSITAQAIRPATTPSPTLSPTSLPEGPAYPPRRGPVKGLRRRRAGLHRDPLIMDDTKSPLLTLSSTRLLAQVALRWAVKIAVLNSRLACSPISMGASSYLFDSARLFSDPAGRGSPATSPLSFASPKVK